MIVSHSKKFIFVKAYKVAGTSVQEALEKECGPGDLVIIDDHDSGKNKNKLPYGVCEIVFFKSARIIQAIYGGIDEIANGSITQLVRVSE